MTLYEPYRVKMDDDRMDAMDRVLFLSNLYNRSATIKNIVAAASTQASLYMIKYPEQKIFGDGGKIIDPLFSDIYERAEAHINMLIRRAKEKKAEQLNKLYR